MHSRVLVTSLPIEVLKTLCSQSFDGIAITEDGKILYASAEFAAMCGYTVAELIGKNATELAMPGPSEAAVHDAIQSNEARTYVATGRHKSGAPILAEIRALPYYWEGRRFRLTAFKDLTASVANESARSESERHIRTVIENSEHGVWQVDSALKTVFVNPRLASMFGYAAEEMVGREIYEFIADTHKELARKHMADRRQGRSSVHELAYQRKDGSVFWALISATPVLSPEGIFTGATAFLTDITERKRAEDALRESNELFQSTFEQAAVGICHNYPNGAWLRFNNRLCEIMGMSREELMGHDISDFLHPSDREPTLAGYFDLLSGKLDRFIGEKRYLRKDGSLVWMRLTASLVRDDQGQPKYFVTICQDITAEKVAEDKLAELRSQMFRLSKASALGEIANGIAHEINNPLSVIRAYTNVLRDGTQDAAHLDYLTKIDTTVHRITQIVRSLAAYTRGNTPEPFQRVRLMSLLQESVSLCEMPLRQAHVSVETSLVNLGAEAEIDCRPVPMTQVLVNLLQNSIDALEGRSDAWIRVSAEELSDDVQLVVEDNGPGIKPEDRARIMQAFYTTKPQHRGTGLGLVISRGIVESHGGSLSLDPTGPYTRFVARIPKRQGEQARAGLRVQRRPSGPATSSDSRLPRSS